MRRIVITVSVWLVLVTVVIGIVLAEGSVRRPGTAAVRAASRDRQMVQMTAHDGINLAGWYGAPSAPNGRCVLVLHGIGDTHKGMSGFVQMFLAAGYRVLAPDSRGHGDSGGEFVTYGVLERRDITDWIGWLASIGCEQGIFALGESMGAAALIEALDGETRIRAAVAECAFSTFEQVAVERVGNRVPLPGALGVWAIRPVVASGMRYVRWRYGFDLASVSPQAALARVQAPVLLIHGLEDRQTIPEHSRVLHKAGQSTELWEVPSAGHVGAFAAGPETFRKRVLVWFDFHAHR